MYLFKCISIILMSATSSSSSIIKVLDRLLIYLKILFDLTKEYDSLAKRSILLNQLKIDNCFYGKVYIKINYLFGKLFWSTLSANT